MPLLFVDAVALETSSISFMAGNPSRPGGPGQGEWNADSSCTFPQGSLRDIRNSLFAQDPSGVLAECMCRRAAAAFFCRVGGWLSFFQFVCVVSVLMCAFTVAGGTLQRSDEENSEHAWHSGERVWEGKRSFANVITISVFFNLEILCTLTLKLTTLVTVVQRYVVFYCVRILNLSCHVIRLGSTMWNCLINNDREPSITKLPWT